jgi:iron complex transport system substrate-binding protein
MDSKQRGGHGGWLRGLGIGLACLGALGFGWRVHSAVRGALAAEQAPAAPGQVSGRTELRHARGFSIEYHPDCKIVRVSCPWPGASRGLTYILVPRGHRPGTVVPGAMVVEMPVRRAISLSTVQAPAFLRLGCPGVLVGMAGVPLLNTPELVAQARRGALAEISDGRPSMDRRLDMERIRLLAPDLVLANGSGDPALDANGKLLEAGFKLVFITDWLEETPLGRAEWIKFTAAFLDREAEAEQFFRKVEADYQRQAARVRDVADRPTVFSGMDYRGTWHMPGGRSYAARFIQDAGGDYLWKDDAGSGSIPLKVEAVLARARDARIWLTYMSAVGSLRAMKETDDRVTLFRAFREGQVYTNDLKVNAAGGNDFWETATLRPDLVLADLIALLHPELGQGHVFRWFRRLPAEPRP